MTFRNRVGEGVLNPCQVSIAVATWGGSLKLKENPKCWTFTRTGIGGKIVLQSYGQEDFLSLPVGATGQEVKGYAWNGTQMAKRKEITFLLHPKKTKQIKVLALDKC